MNNNQRLQEHMKTYKLSFLDVTRFCRVTLPTVDKWLQPDTSDQYQEMPDKYPDLLETKLTRGGWVKR